MAYAVFTRAWWQHNPDWPDGLEPDGNAARTYLARHIATESEAREIARKWNATHNPGPLCIKAEIETMRPAYRRSTRKEA